MSRRTLVTVAAVAVMVGMVAVGGLLRGGQAYAASSQQTFLTFYGFFDNTPPSADIAFPKIHKTAGGKGTFADPITFATSSAELKPGTKVFVPRVGKYFIMEDDCTECGLDWKGHGPDGGPRLRHIDLWLDGRGGSEFAAIDCEDALTKSNPDGTAFLEPVIANPPSNEPVSNEPLFNPKNNRCFGGAQATRTVGRYKNVSTGQCIDDPGDSTTSGTALKTAACSAATSQQFTFEGAFLSIHTTLCAASSGGKIVLTKCTGGPAQQWSINTNKTISDIQTSRKCFRASGGNVLAGSCSGAASQWTFIKSS